MTPKQPQAPHHKHPLNVPRPLKNRPAAQNTSPKPHVASCDSSSQWFFSVPHYVNVVQKSPTSSISVNTSESHSHGTKRPAMIADVWIHHILPFLPFKYLQHSLFLSRQIMIRGLQALDLNELSLQELYMMKNLGLLVLDENARQKQNGNRHVASPWSDVHSAAAEPVARGDCSENVLHLYDHELGIQSNSRYREKSIASSPASSHDKPLDRRRCVTEVRNNLASVSESISSTAHTTTPFFGELIPISTRSLLKCYKLTQTTRARLDEYSRIMKYVPPLNLQSISEPWRQDKEIVLVAVQQDPFILQYLPFEMRYNSDILSAALEACGFVLRYVDEAHQTRAVVAQALRSKGLALQYAAPQWRQDRELVKVALREHGFAIQYIDESLKEDRELILLAVRSDANVLSLLSENFTSDREIMEAAVSLDGLALRYAALSLRQDGQLVRRAVQQNGHALKFASESLTKDKSIVKEAVRQDGALIRYAHSSLQEDQDVLDSRVTFHFC